MSDTRPPMGFNQAFSFGDWFRRRGLEAPDPAAVLKANEDRLEALVRANREALDGNRRQVELQPRILDEIMPKTWASLTRLNPAGASAGHLAACAATARTAIGLMQRLSDETRFAVEDACRRIADRIHAPARASHGA